MAKEKDQHITVTTNDQNRTIKLENPNLKIVSKKGEQISVHNFFELFSTIDRTKKIKKQLEKEISMLKRLKISFQKKLKKVKTAKLLSIKSLKEKENFLIKHYEEIINKMKTQAQEEIKIQFSEFKKDLVKEKEKSITDVISKKEETDALITDFKKHLTEEKKLTQQNTQNNEAMFTEKTQELNLTLNTIRETILKEIEETKLTALQEVEDTGTTRENFKKFTKVSQDYIKNTINGALSEIDIIKTTLSSEVSELTNTAKNEFQEIKQNADLQKNALKSELNTLKDTLRTEINKMRNDTEEELKIISKQTKQESSENLKTILNNIEDFSNKTKAEIAKLTTKFETEQDTMLKNTYKDLQRLQAKLQEIDKTDDIRAINEEFKEIKKQNELFLEDIKFNINQAYTQSIDEVLNRMKGIKSANKEELQLIKSEISEHENLFYSQIQNKLDNLLEASKSENETQIQTTQTIINELKQEIEQEVKFVKQDLHQEKLHMLETAMDDLSRLKEEIHQKAELQIVEATGLLQDFKQSFENSQKEMLAQNREHFQKMEQENNLKMQEQLNSTKNYIENLKKDSIKYIHELTKDVENEQKILNKLIVQVKGIKTTLETGVFADLEGTLKNIESIKQTHAFQMDNLKKENQRTQQETVRQLKVMVEESIESRLEKAMNKINHVQEQLKAEKNQLTESAIKLNKLQSQTQQEFYEQLENTLTNVNIIKEEADKSVKQLKNESFTEIVNIKKRLNQIIGYLKKQRMLSEKKILSPTTIIPKKDNRTNEELLTLLLKEDLNF